jgi:hypothetical protein
MPFSLDIKDPGPNFRVVSTGLPKRARKAAKTQKTFWFLLKTDAADKLSHTIQIGSSHSKGGSTYGIASPNGEAILSLNTNKSYS